jgi:hypothetical protein
MKIITLIMIIITTITVTTEIFKLKKSTSRVTNVVKGYSTTSNLLNYYSEGLIYLLFFLIIKLCIKQITKMKKTILCD